MTRPVTLFTGQWADLSFEDLAAKVGAWDFDGLELCTWGDHFEVPKALSDSSYCAGRTWGDSPRANSAPAALHFTKTRY